MIIFFPYFSYYQNLVIFNERNHRFCLLYIIFTHKRLSNLNNFNSYTSLAGNEATNIRFFEATGEEANIRLFAVTGQGSCL